MCLSENGKVAITGSNRTATEGEQVTFQCLATDWFPAAQLSWTINGTPVDKGLYNTNDSASNGLLMNSNSTLKITATGNVAVACLATISTLPSPEISSVFLTVRKRCHIVQCFQCTAETDKNTVIFIIIFLH